MFCHSKGWFGAGPIESARFDSRSHGLRDHLSLEWGRCRKKTGFLAEKHCSSAPPRCPSCEPTPTQTTKLVREAATLRFHHQLSSKSEPHGVPPEAGRTPIPRPPHPYSWWEDRENGKSRSSRTSVI